jgi:sulfite exporter TauE/SafE
MHELALITMFIAGLLGSTHCLAMCGGIATALGAVPGAAMRRPWQPLLYQAGRLLSYGMAGCVAGAVGAGPGLALSGRHWSELLRLATALMVVAIGLRIALGGRAPGRWLQAPERLGARLWRRIAPSARAALPTAPGARALALGLIWGWLPCGLVYTALLAAALAGGAGAGGATMIAFGLGTVPAMLGLSCAGARLPRPDGTFARLLGSVIVACGIWTATLPLAALTGSHRHDHHGMSMMQ